MNKPVVFSLSCYDTQIVTRSFMERWFTLPWRPFQKTRTVVVPGLYREKDVIKAHPDHVTTVYNILHQVEDTPTLKVKAIRNE